MVPSENNIKIVNTLMKVSFLSILTFKTLLKPYQDLSNLWLRFMCCFFPSSRTELVCFVDLSNLTLRDVNEATFIITLTEKAGAITYPSMQIARLFRNY